MTYCDLLHRPFVYGLFVSCHVARDISSTGTCRKQTSLNAQVFQSLSYFLSKCCSHEVRGIDFSLSQYCSVISCLGLCQ